MSDPEDDDAPAPEMTAEDRERLERIERLYDEHMTDRKNNGPWPVYTGDGK